MIIFGSRTLSSSQGGGVFQCPRCSMQRNYNHKRLNRWFTLYFIPCIPLGSAGEYVECTSCGGTYGVEVLRHSPQVDRSEIYATIRRLAVLAMVRAQRLGPENIGSLRGALRDLTGSFVSEDQIQEDARLAQQANAQVPLVFRQQGNDFTPDGKVHLLKIIRNALAPNSAIESTERHVLEQAADAMGVRRDALDRIIAGTEV